MSDPTEHLRRIGLNREINQLRAEVASLKAQLSSNERDAKRYHKTLEIVCSDDPKDLLKAFDAIGGFAGLFPTKEEFTDAMDAAIDAAISSPQPAIQEDNLMNKEGGKS